MELYRFDAAVGRPISKHGSRFVQLPLTSPEGGVRAACFHLPPGGVVGRHEAATRQLLCVVAGDGLVSGSAAVASQSPPAGRVLGRGARGQHDAGLTAACWRRQPRGLGGAGRVTAASAAGGQRPARFSLGRSIQNRLRLDHPVDHPVEVNALVRTRPDGRDTRRELRESGWFRLVGRCAVAS
jgi:hypothetical protein